MKKMFTRHILSLSLLLLSIACPAICGVVLGQQITTFSFTNGVQTYTVPTGVTFLDIKVQGASGGAGTGTGAGAGGLGSEVKGRLAVTPGTVLYIYVGSAGTAFSGGFNGGGSPGTNGGGGGGASDIRIGGTTTSNRVAVAAGGGGGGGGTAGFAGGAGGGSLGVGSDGLPAATLGGKGGTQAIGGPGGGTSCTGGTTITGAMGTFGQGANAAGSGGAGGGGFFGGGSGAINTGGSCTNGAGGGGGGSSMVSTSVVSNYTITTGTVTGNGSVEITTPQVPSAITTGHLPVNANTYQLKADVFHNGANTNVYFEYSNSPTLGSGVITVGWTLNPILSTTTGVTSVTESIGGLTANTTYYYRVKAQNSVGTTNGAILNFTTPNTAPVLISGATQSISMCQNSKDFNITSLLHVNDTDPAQSITWSVAQMPDKNGSLGGFSSTNASVAGSANITPGNAITYTPITGFKGTETFKIQVSDGKSSDTIEFTATVNPLPAPIITRNGFDLSTGSFAIYLWKRNNIEIIGADKQVYTMTEGGDYTVTVTDVNGCTATSNIYKYPTVSVDEVEAVAMGVYPNPAISVLHVDAPGGSIISITGMDGKVAISQAAGAVDVSNLVPGVYVLRIYSRAGALLKTSRLVKAAG